MIDIKPLAKKYLSELKATINKIDVEDIQKVADLLLEAYKNDKTVYVLGNGGSASTASHIACDWGKGTLSNIYNTKEKRFRVISLTDNVASMTAFANDLSYDDVFVQQLHNLIKPGDIVIGISGSGNTPNVIKAFLYAKEQGAKTIGFLGYRNGGKSSLFVDCAITIQSNSYGIIEDLHLTIDHVLTTCLAYMKQHSDKQSIEVVSSDRTIKDINNKAPKVYLSAEWVERSARR